MHQPMNLEELKTEAQKQNYLVIRREGETAWRPLKNWKGDPTWGVSYVLIGNRVLATTGRENDVHCYTLT